MCWQEYFLVETIKNRIIIRLLFSTFGETYRRYRILLKISAENPFFGSHIGFMGRAKRKILRRFVDNSYLEEFTKVFPEIPSCHGAAAKMLNLGYYFTPGFHIRVKGIHTVGCHNC
jgi:hypothetical protein